MRAALICLCAMGLLFASACGGQAVPENEPYATVTFAAASAAGLALSVNAVRTDGPPCGLEESIAMDCAALDGTTGEVVTTDPLCTGTWDFADMLLWADPASNCPTGSNFAWCDDITGATLSDGNNTLSITCHSSAQGTVTFDVDLDP